MRWAISWRFNWIDLVVLIIVVRATQVGTLRGVWVEALRLASIAGAILAGAVAAAPFATQVMAFIGWDQRVAQIVTFFSLTVLVALLCIPLRRWLGRAFAQHTIVLWNQMAGGVLGCSSGVLMAGLAAWAIAFLPGNYLHSSVLERSLTGGYVIDAVQLVVRLLPEGQALKW